MEQMQMKAVWDQADTDPKRVDAFYDAHACEGLVTARHGLKRAVLFVRRLRILPERTRAAMIKPL